jgi:arylsulfatase A-like enzyme
MRFVRLLSVSLCLLHLAGFASANESPNVLVILTDQHRQDGIGAYARSPVKTPHLDRIAREGIRFDRAYVAQPVCSPNRASILTGYYPHAHGVLENNVPLPSKAVALSEMLSERGYECGYFGKWHLDRRNDQGFTTFPNYPRDGRGQNHYFFDKNNNRRYAVDVITDDVLAFLNKKRSGPFFAFVSYYPPHPPYSVPEQYERMYREAIPKDRNQRIYYGMCTKVDEQVGRLLGALDDMDATKHTLVVFTTEHGHFFKRRWNDHAKRLCYDTASRIPLLMRMPGVIPPRQTTTELISSVDLTPTILGLLGQETPQGLQGSDLSGLARGTSKTGRDVVFIENTPYPYKPEKGRERCVFDGRWKLILSNVRAPELYDLHSDPEEFENHWPKQRNSAEAQALLEQLRTWGKRTKDPLTPHLLSQLEKAQK